MAEDSSRAGANRSARARLASALMATGGPLGRRSPVELARARTRLRRRPAVIHLVDPGRLPEPNARAGGLSGRLACSRGAAARCSTPFACGCPRHSEQRQALLVNRLPGLLRCPPSARHSTSAVPWLNLLLTSGRTTFAGGRVDRVARARGRLPHPSIAPSVHLIASRRSFSSSLFGAG